MRTLFWICERRGMAMKKIAAALLLILSILVTGDLLAKDKSANGVYRPTLMTNPKKYLREFQLNKATQEEVIQYMGTPDKTYALSGSDFLTYSIATKTGSGIVEYTFEIKDGVVVNVTYLNSGNFFNVTQRESAKQLQQSP